MHGQTKIKYTFTPPLGLLGRSRVNCILLPHQNYCYCTLKIFLLLSNNFLSFSLFSPLSNSGRIDVDFIPPFFKIRWVTQTLINVKR